MPQTLKKTQIQKDTSQFIGRPANAGLLLRFQEGIATVLRSHRCEEPRRSQTVVLTACTRLTDAGQALFENFVTQGPVLAARVVADVVSVAARLELRVGQRRCRYIEVSRSAAVGRATVSRARHRFRRTGTPEPAGVCLRETGTGGGNHN